MKIGSEVLVCEKKVFFFHGHDQIKLHTDHMKRVVSKKRVDFRCDGKFFIVHHYSSVASMTFSFSDLIVVPEQRKLNVGMFH